MMNTIRFIVKIPLAVLFILTPVLVGILIQKLPLSDRFKTNASKTIIQIASRLVVPVMGVKIKFEGETNILQGHPVLIASNHLSYIDVVVIAKYFKALFITSMETKESSIEGTICKACGCIFIERRNRDNIDKEISHVASFLKKGHNVAFFPEATSTNGEKVLPFKMSFFESALQAKVPVQPLSLSVEKINGQPVDETNRDGYCYYDDMSFGDHLLNFLKLRSVELKLRALPIKIPTENEDRKSLSVRAHDTVSEAYQPILN